MRAWLRDKVSKWLGLHFMSADIASWAGERVVMNDRITKLERKVHELEEFVQDVVHIGVDVHFKEPHMILIYTRLGGGQIREIEADFRDLVELNRYCRELKERYRTRAITYDLPHGLPWEWLK